MILRQTTAIFLDAYRELNAKKLFWVTLGISAVVMLALAAVGINETGISLLGRNFESGWFNTTLIEREAFYKLMFQTVGLGIWLAWAAMILALISTAGMIPDFVASGSIELTLSKPIGRVRLFLTKYAAALVFVVLQVTVFSLAGFLLIGIRGGAWEPALFLAVPLVTLFFSYLYCVAALVGLMTRSTIAALMAALIFWLLIFAANSLDAILLRPLTTAELQVERRSEITSTAENKLAELKQELAEAEAAVDAEPTPENREAVDSLRRRVEIGERFTARAREELTEAEESLERWLPWHRGVFVVKSVLPKTGETVGLLERQILELADLEKIGPPRDEPQADSDATALLGPAPSRQRRLDVTDEEIELRMAEKYRERSVAWVVGTSLIFEVVIVGLTCVIFVRRDF